MSKCPKCGGTGIRCNGIRRAASFIVGATVGTILTGGRGGAHAAHGAEKIFNDLTPTKDYICTDCGYVWKVESKL